MATWKNEPIRNFELSSGPDRLSLETDWGLADMIRLGKSLREAAELENAEWVFQSLDQLPSGSIVQCIERHLRRKRRKLISLPQGWMTLAGEALKPGIYDVPTLLTDGVLACHPQFRGGGGPPWLLLGMVAGVVGVLIFARQ
jgi:hypothetical protein